MWKYVKDEQFGEGMEMTNILEKWCEKHAQ